MQEGLFGAKGRFGFGCMRLPMASGEIGFDGEVDIDQVKDMVDAFMDAGYNYFDTAHGYTAGKSETALRECLVERYPRESFLLVDKLTGNHWETEADIRPLLEEELQACGVDYFDALLMHAQNGEFYKRYKENGAYRIALEFVAEGKARHFGISFHGKAADLELILDEQPAIEVVQLQLNYMDYEDNSVEGRKCYEACERRGVPVVVMEPLRGGSLVDLPQEAKAVVEALPGGVTPAELALRWCAELPNVAMVLSGVSTLQQMQQNCATLANPQPLTTQEKDAIDGVRAVFDNMDLIRCTACRYCVGSCPQNIAIPDLFSVMNTHEMYHNWNSGWYYMVYTQTHGAAKDCIACGSCVAECPQGLDIPALMEKVSAQFDKD
ncbi:MAG: aldo/keto reductase [Coriobacteriia bacterium]|nr:aldo/keto reductase [Coriobacteriia bacterium]